MERFATLLAGRMQARTAASPMVGRQDELAELEDALASARDGHASTVLVGGEAGVGKSRLIAAFADRAREGDARVLVGGCLELGVSSPPFAAVVEALRGLTDEVGIDPLRRLLGDGIRDLRSLVPALGSGGTHPPGTSDVDPSAQTRLFEVLLGLLRRLGRERTQVLVLEDVHWADPSTRDLLVYLAHNLQRTPVLLVATYRSDELHRLHPLRSALSELGRSHRTRQLELAPLTRDDLAVLVESWLGTEPSRDLVDRIHDRSQGNPFFAEELVAADADRGDGALPASLREVLLTTVDALPDATGRLLRVAAAAGRRVHHELLTRVSGLPDDELDESLRPAVDRLVLVPDAGSGTYAFRHALLAEAVRSRLLPGEQARVHRRLAEALEDDPSLADEASAAELAHHWHEAGDRERALTASIDAAREAELKAAFIDARVHVERALELWDHVEAPETRAGTDHVSLLSLAARLAHLAGEARRAVALLEVALDELPEDVDNVFRGRLHHDLGRYRSAIGDLTGAEEAWERAESLVPATPATVARAEVLVSRARVLSGRFRWDEARQRAEEALAVAREVGDRRSQGRALVALARAFGGLRRLDDAVTAMREAEQIAEAEDSAEDVAHVAQHLSSLLIRGGRLEDGAEAALAGLARARELGVGRLAGSLLAGNATSGLFHAGRWDEAAELLAEVSGDTIGVSWLNLLQARLLAHRGFFDEARSALADAKRFHAEGDEREPVVALAIPVLEGNHRQAHELVLARVAPSPLQHGGTINGFRAWALRAEADRVAAGAVEDPREVRVLADELLAETTERRGEEIAHAPAWGLTAVAEHARLGDGPPVDAWEEVVDAWEAIGWVYQAAYGRFRLAEALVAGGRPDEAAEHVHVAAEVADRLRAAPLGAGIRALARRAGLALGTSGASTRRGHDRPHGLTPRELEVLRLVAEGRRNREIAATLHISDKTVSVHVSNILRKLEVSARTEAAAVAHREGLLTLRR